VKILGIKIYSLKEDEWVQELLKFYPKIDYLCSNSGGQLLKHHIDINSLSDSNSQKPDFFDSPQLPRLFPTNDDTPHYFSQIEFSLTFERETNENMDIELFYEELNVIPAKM
jgi:hypothetical protein